MVDLRLCCSHMTKTGFLMTWLKLKLKLKLILVLGLFNMNASVHFRKLISPWSHCQYFIILLINDICDTFTISVNIVIIQLPAFHSKCIENME